MTPHEEWVNGHQGPQSPEHHGDRSSKRSIRARRLDEEKKEKAPTDCLCCFLTVTARFSDVPVQTTALPMHCATGQQRLSPVAEW